MWTSVSLSLKWELVTPLFLTSSVFLRLKEESARCTKCKFLLSHSGQVGTQCIKRRNPPFQSRSLAQPAAIRLAILCLAVPGIGQKSETGVLAGCSRGLHIFSHSTHRFSLLCAPGQDTPLPQELTAFLDRLIWVVSTVIVYVTLPGLRDAVTIGTLKVAGPADPAGTVRTVLIWAIPAVIDRVTLPGFWDAALVGALPLIRLTLVVLYKQGNVVIGLEGVGNGSY